MTIKIPNPANENEEIEVYTADEVAARETTMRTTVEGEWKPKFEEITGKLTEAEKAAAQRAGEFAQFRKLSDEQVAKLDEAQRTIYNNGLVLEEERKKGVERETNLLNSTIDASLRAKAGKDEKLFQKMKDTWAIIGVEATTPEQIEQKTLMVLGAISTTAPDLVASVAGFGGGSFEPPKQNNRQDGESFADTAQGKAGASELGLLMETPKAK